MSSTASEFGAVQCCNLSDSCKSEGGRLELVEIREPAFLSLFYLTFFDMSVRDSRRAPHGTVSKKVDGVAVPIVLIVLIVHDLAHNSGPESLDVRLRFPLCAASMRQSNRLHPLSREVDLDVPSCKCQGCGISLTFIGLRPTLVGSVRLQGILSLFHVGPRAGRFADSTRALSVENRTLFSRCASWVPR